METTQKKDEGILLVVSGPSGAGKGTICDAIRKLYPDLQYSVSMTTRQPRNGEVEGKSYFFRTNEEFEKLIAEDAFLEYAKVYDHYYGTPKKRALDMIGDGKSVLLELDIQGAMQVKERYPKGVFIYIVPPSLEILSGRLHQRGTDSEEVIEKRLACAAEGDFALALYNPSSKGRPEHLQRAVKILRAHGKPADTVCGIVRSIGREGQESRILTLAQLEHTPVDMFTTVFIGNAATRALSGRMVTPRGYRP